MSADSADAGWGRVSAGSSLRWEPNSCSQAGSEEDKVRAASRCSLSAGIPSARTSFHSTMGKGSCSGLRAAAHGPSGHGDKVAKLAPLCT